MTDTTTISKDKFVKIWKDEGNLRVGFFNSDNVLLDEVPLEDLNHSETKEIAKEMSEAHNIRVESGYGVDLEGGDNIKAELQKSGNVKSVDIHGDEAVNINAVEELTTISITLSEDGYGFEVLRSKYPGLRIQNIYHDDEGIQVVAEYRRPTE